MCSRRLENHDRAIEAGQRALALTGPPEDIACQVAARFFLDTVYYNLGESRRVIDDLRQTIALLQGDLLYERFGLIGIASVWCRTILVQCLAECGVFSEAMAHGEEAVRIAESADHPLSLIAAYRGIGILSLRQGNLDRTIAVLERGLALCQTANVPHQVPNLGLALGSAYALCGRITEALSLLEEMAKRASYRSSIIMGLSEAYMLAGYLEQASEHAERALALARVHKERGYQAYAVRLLGEIAVRREPLESDSAEAHYRQALALADELGMRPLQAHCHRGLGALYLTLGQREQARTALSAAIDLYRAMEMTFWLPQAEAMLARVKD